MEKKAVFCIRCDGLYLDRFRDSLKALEKDHAVEILNNYSSLQQITDQNPVVLLSTIRTQADLVDLIQALQLQSKAFAARQFIVMVVQTGLSDKHEKLLIQSGVKEVLPDRSDLRGVNSKIDRYLKIVLNNYQKNQEDIKTKTLVSAQARSSSGESANLDLVEFFEPIALSHDFWVINEKRPAQRNMGRWIITAMGPSPATGSWVVDPKNPKYYRFEVPVYNKFGFHSPDGLWVFQGSKPEFSFELGRWSFVGSDPRLEWVNKQGSVVVTRLFYHPQLKKLAIAKNSEVTRNWVSRIEATFDRDFRFKEEKFFGGDVSGLNPEEQPPENDKNMEELVKDIPPDVVKFLKEAKQEFAPKSEMFSKVEEAKFNQFLKVAGEYRDRGILWLGGRVFLSDLIVYNVDLQARVAEVMVVPPRADPMSLIDEGLTTSEDKKVYVNLKLVETSLFFYATRDEIKCEEGILKIPIPSFAYEVQRRGGFRLSNSPKVRGLEFRKIPPTAKGSWKIIDISPGGVGIETQADSFNFDKDKTFKIELALQDVVLSLICSPRWVKPPDAKGKIRVGLRFEHLSQSMSDKLEIYIMEKHLERIRQGIVKS